MENTTVLVTTFICTLQRKRFKVINAKLVFLLFVIAIIFFSTSNFNVYRWRHYLYNPLQYYDAYVVFYWYATNNKKTQYFNNIPMNNAKSHFAVFIEVKQLRWLTHNLFQISANWKKSWQTGRFWPFWFLKNCNIHVILITVYYLTHDVKYFTC